MANIPVNANDASITVDVNTNGRVTFNFDFRADNVGDLTAIYRETGQPDRFLFGGVNFTATGLGTANGGTITLTTFTDTKLGAKLTIYRDTVIKRLTDFTRDLFANNINLEMDQIFMILQELRRGIKDSVGVAPGEEIPDLTEVIAKLSQFPTIGSGDADKVLAVRPDLLGYYLAAISGGGGGGGSGGGVQAFSSRAAASGATIDPAINLLVVVHSGQQLFYRRYTEGGVAEAYAPLTTNGGTVFWSPACDFSPLHWGAAGDGVTNDRIVLQNMMRFLYGTPASNGAMPAAFDGQRPFVVTGHNRVYALSAPWVWGNIGTAVDTGMIYNFRLKDMRLKAIAGDWTFPLIDNVPQRYLIMAGWNFAADYTDELSGIYDVMLDHVTFDCSFLTGATWICNTYQFVLDECRSQHPGIDCVVHDTSVRSASQGTRPFGYNTGNGAYTIVGLNVEGLVGESGAGYPGGRDIATMGTIGVRIYTNDAKVNKWIASRVSTAADLWGGAMLVSDIHPWSREVRIRPTANNIMVANAYLDYTKFILESFVHMFVGCHWILPTGAGADRGVELRASIAGETADGLIFTGCTFGGESLDIRFTTTGAGSWVGDKARKHSLTGNSYRTGHTIAQIERFQDKHGYTVASGAHYFRTADPTVGENRLVGDIMYIGKDRTVNGGASVQLQSQAGDQTTGGLYSYGAGGLGLLNSFAGAFIEIGTVNTPGALFIHGTTGKVNSRMAFTVENDGAEDDAIIAESGDIRALLAGIATNSKRTMAVTDTVAGCRFTGNSGTICQTPGQGTSSASLNLARREAGALLRGGIDGTAIGTAGIFIASGGVLSYVTGSDERLKQDFKPIDPGLIDLIDAFDFEMVAAPGARHHGLLAQQVMKAIPGAVQGDGVIDEPEEWAEAHPDEEWTPGYYGLDYSKTTPLLFAVSKDNRAEIKELKALVEKLVARVAELEGKA